MKRTSLSIPGFPRILCVATAATLCASSFSPAFADSFAERPWGYDSPAGSCVVCHSLEKGGAFRVAPNLWNIVGADIGRDRAWFNYSPGLLAVGGTWTTEELDRFLEDAAAFAPGSTKSIRVKDAGRRAEIVDYLSELSD